MNLTLMKRVSIYILPMCAFVFLALLSTPNISLAQNVSCYKNPIAYIDSLGTPVDTVPRFLLALIDLIFLIAVPVIVVCIIYGGFLFVMAGDSETKISKARTVILWTIIGAAVLLGAKALELAIQATICSLDPNSSICSSTPVDSAYSCTP